MPQPIRAQPPIGNPQSVIRNSKGFSLVEVVLALAVVAFAFVAILGLIPAGMTTFRQAINISVCSQIGQKIIADAVQSDFDTLMTDPRTSKLTPSGVAFRAYPRFFDEEGTEIRLPASASSPDPYAVPPNTVYTVNTKIDPKLTLPGTPATSYQTALITVQVIYNPGGYKLIDSDFGSADPYKLLVTTPHILPQNVLTYYAHITRN